MWGASGLISEGHPLASEAVHEREEGRQRRSPPESATEGLDGFYMNIFEGIYAICNFK